jgi:hypothetical protein
MLRWQDGGGQSRQERVIAAGSGLFYAGQTAEFENGQARTADSLLANVATHSNFLVMDEPERTRQLDQVRGFLQSRPETSQGEFVLPMVTVALRVQRR